MIDIKIAAPAIITGVAAAGMSVKKIVVRRQYKKLIAKVNEELENIDALFPEQSPFDRAQTIISDRMLDGYYDDKSDDVVTNDFTVLYANFLNS